MNIISAMYQAARIANTINAFMYPQRLPRRIKNIFLGRFIARLGIWK